MLFYFLIIYIVFIFVILIHFFESHRGTQVEVKNKKGNSPLWLAANGGHLNVVDLLYHAGADIDSQDNRKVYENFSIYIYNILIGYIYIYIYPHTHIYTYI